MATLATTGHVVYDFFMCYANACYKGEENVPMSMDIVTEKFGGMLAGGISSGCRSSTACQRIIS